MKQRGLLATAVKLSVWIAVLMGVLLVPLLGWPGRGDSVLFLIPFFLFLVVAVVFRMALPSVLEKQQATLVRNDQRVEPTVLIALGFSLGVLWRVMLTQIVAVVLQQFIYRFFAMMADFVFVELVMAALILFLQCFVSVWWLLRFPYGRYQVRFSNGR